VGAIISITVNPLLYRLVGPLESALRRFIKTPTPPALPAQGHEPGADEPGRSARHRAVVIGYGPVGRTVTRLLVENRVEPVLIELNIDTVRRVGGQGIRAVYGDATHRDTLERAGLADAIVLILSSSSMHGSGETIRLARELNRRVLIFARSDYLREHQALRDAGADVVFSGEGEVALSMTEFLLRQLGATAEQVDRERARIRSELFGGLSEGESLPEDRAWPESAAEVPSTPGEGSKAG